MDKQVVLYEPRCAISVMSSVRKRKDFIQPL